MKKLLLLPLLMLFFSITNAQDSKFEIGPEIGANFSSYAFSDGDFDDKSLTRISFGAIAKINFSENWSLKGKLKYDGKGSKANDGSFEEKLNYITLPVMAEWNFGNGDLKGFLNFGLYAGFLTSAKTEFEDGEELDIKDDVKSTDFGGAYGIGIIYKLKDNMNLIFEIGGQTGAIDLEDGEGSALIIRNQVLSANIGVTFGI
ncbi:porin family protein [Ichthyenterobacterium magnum]|uniref:Outer membrane protein with beta-barrel domain n=1 Tax=Ichthyenterobacterium magnum TaxID=1230530 RepID=A0A420DCV9_9FLAO|nr:porin family protein [Ichthyenterobacterium magnum]RKE89429.1 outer membrane protein with beta-barrel domain [Ichthyenterobacterium magnum]